MQGTAAQACFSWTPDLRGLQVQTNSPHRLFGLMQAEIAGLTGPVPEVPSVGEESCAHRVKQSGVLENREQIHLAQWP